MIVNVTGWVAVLDVDKVDRGPGGALPLYVDHIVGAGDVSVDVPSRPGCSLRR